MKSPLFPPARVIVALAITSASVALAACGMLPDEDRPSAIEGNPPRQFLIRGDPLIIRHRNPDSMVYAVKVIARDSTPHLEWTPTTALVETDRGYRKEALLVPYACLQPLDSEIGYPLTTQWLACDAVAINNSTILSHHQVREIEEAVNGKLFLQYNYRTFPGALYFFRVPVGQEQVAEAIRRIDRLPYTDQTEHISHAPECVTSDVLPPPPCDPWFLTKRYHYTTGAASGDTLPVSPNGWIRVTYTLPNGSKRVSQTTISDR